MTSAGVLTDALLENTYGMLPVPWIIDEFPTVVPARYREPQLLDRIAHMYLQQKKELPEVIIKINACFTSKDNNNYPTASTVYHFIMELLMKNSQSQYAHA